MVAETYLISREQSDQFHNLLDLNQDNILSEEEYKSGIRSAVKDIFCREKKFCDSSVKPIEDLKHQEYLNWHKRFLDNHNVAYLAYTGQKEISATIEGPYEGGKPLIPSGKTFWYVKFNYHKIKVIVKPPKYPDELVYTGIKDILLAIATIPPNLAQSVNKVIIRKDVTPMDRFRINRAKQKGECTPTSCKNRIYQMAMPNGDIHVFPTMLPISNLDLTQALLHEFSHSWSFKNWGLFPISKKWNAWRQAMRADGEYLTKYAEISIYEDFAETLSLYLLWKESQLFHSNHRSKVLHRFELLDSLFAKEAF